MQHIFYSDGNTKKISWVIKTNDTIVNQDRIHAEMYKDKVTNIQSKYIALHVGLFWGIGVFIIKNEDSIKIKLDEKIMYNHFTVNSKIEDELIQKRIQFIRQLVKQRELKIDFEIIDKSNNLASNIED
ncbi:MAG: hypothetical protein ACRBB2_01090 [Nitrosopumilus sp.]